MVIVCEVDDFWCVFVKVMMTVVMLIVVTKDDDGGGEWCWYWR